MLKERIFIHLTGIDMNWVDVMCEAKKNTAGVNISEGLRNKEKEIQKEMDFYRTKPLSDWFMEREEKFLKAKAWDELLRMIG